MEIHETPVLIVGAGPVGTMTALLLRRMGVGACIVERRDGPKRAPAAHAVNARTFEICRQAGVDMQAIAAACVAPEDGGAVHWVTRLGGERLGSLPYERQGDDVLAFTPTPLRNLSQHRFEPILLRDLEAAGAEPPRFGHTWLDAATDSDGVTSTIAENATGRRYQLRSRYLVAADGAGSPVRKSLGIAPVGPERLQSFLMIHFEASLRPLLGDHPGVLFWVMDPDCFGTFVAHDIDREWVFMHAFDPEREPAESFDTARCEALVRHALARADVELEIRSISPWHMTCQVAERYAEGRTFLVGDAAHRFPPTGGLGLNTGVQDAHNLAWKLATVLDRRAPAALLATYEPERRPVAERNAEQSLANALRLLEVPSALGLGPDLEQSRRSYRATLADPARRGEVEAAIARQAEHFDLLGLQLGFSYEQGALLPDGTEPVQPADPVRDFVPSSRPGSRLPHGWLERDGDTFSSLDLIPLARPVLLVGPDGAAWADAAGIQEPPLEHVRIGVDVADPADWWGVAAGMERRGALLVRPDQHVSFRAQAVPADPKRALREALAATFGFAPITDRRARPARAGC